MIPKSEFARRLCTAAHYRQSPIPCGQHIAEAERYWVLLSPAGTRIMEVIKQARIEGKVDRP